MIRELKKKKKPTQKNKAKTSKSCIVLVQLSLILCFLSNKSPPLLRGFFSKYQCLTSPTCMNNPTIAKAVHIKENFFEHLLLVTQVFTLPDHPYLMYFPLPFIHHQFVKCFVMDIPRRNNSLINMSYTWSFYSVLK